MFLNVRPIYMIAPFVRVYKVMRRNLQPTKPETPGQTPSDSVLNLNSISTRCYVSMKTVHYEINHI